MRTINILAAVLLTVTSLTSTSANAEYISRDCEEASRPAQKSACYRQYNELMLNIRSDIRQFYMGGQLAAGWWPEQKLLEWKMNRSANIGKIITDICQGDQACIFDLLIQERYAIEEKIERYKSGRANFRQEVTANFNRRANFPMPFHSDSPMMVKKYGLSNEDSLPDWFAGE